MQNNEAVDKARRKIEAYVQRERPDLDWEVKREHTGPIDLVWTYARHPDLSITMSTMLPTIHALDSEKLQAHLPGILERILRQLDGYLLFGTIEDYIGQDKGETTLWN